MYPVKHDKMKIFSYKYFISVNILRQNKRSLSFLTLLKRNPKADLIVKIFI